MRQTILTSLLLLASSTVMADTSVQVMQELISLAQTQLKNPFAAAIVEEKTGRIICKGLNDSAHNPTLHGEMVAINTCIAKNPSINWAETTLYTTAEPCAMCQSAIMWAGIPRVVYGTSIPSLKKFQWYYINIRATEVAKLSNFYKGTVTGGLLSKETDKLFSHGP